MMIQNNNIVSGSSVGDLLGLRMPIEIYLRLSPILITTYRMDPNRRQNDTLLRMSQRSFLRFGSLGC